MKQYTDTEIDALLLDIVSELKEAAERFPAMNSAHEAYAVLLEEIDELWEEVRVKQGQRLPHRMRREAIQVAAMAMRFALDVCGERSGQK